MQNPLSTRRCKETLEDNQLTAFTEEKNTLDNDDEDTNHTTTDTTTQVPEDWPEESPNDATLLLPLLPDKCLQQQRKWPRKWSPNPTPQHVVKGRRPLLFPALRPKAMRYNCYSIDAAIYCCCTVFYFCCYILLLLLLYIIAAASHNSSNIIHI